MEAADPTFYLTQSQYSDTRPTSPSADPITPCTWQGSHWNTKFYLTGMTRIRKRTVAKLGIEPRSATLEVDALATKLTRGSGEGVVFLDSVG